ncbi:TrmB family transcriptional regulator [Haloarchaeobius sp. DT45]|uniref:TrmB family transcriptional regulator n=1 Tax=Haloarchaeobius sp. DT45 TaxID=3446116 RepID=UPI003F6C5B17
MSHTNPVEEATTLLKDLGLKQYEAKCYVALAQLPTGTAKKVSDVSGVPRTRVYEAVRRLESKGLVAVQKSSPRRFRAVPISDAVRLIRNEYATRLDELAETLRDIEPKSTETENEVSNVWTLSGTDAISTRALSFVREATDEVITVFGSMDDVTDEFVEALVAATDRGVETYVGTLSEAVQTEFERRVPEATVFQSGLEWFLPPEDQYGSSIGRLLLVDGSTLLLSSVSGNPPTERAVWGEGLENGLVLVAHRVASVGIGNQFDH